MTSTAILEEAMPRALEAQLLPARRVGAIGYLTSQYPAVSHTFIFEEIQALCALEMPLKVAAIHIPEARDWMGAAERAECARTYCMAEQSVGHYFLSHLDMLARHPVRYARIVRSALHYARTSSSGFSKTARHITGAVLLIEWARKENVRHVHVHFGDVAGTVALIARAGGGPPFSLSIHGPDIFDDVRGNLLTQKLNAAAFVRCISHFCQSQVMRFMDVENWERLHIVRCGVDVDMFHPRREPNNPVPQILCVGRLVPAKGHAILLRACHELTSRGVNFHLTLIGDGPYRPLLEQMTRTLGMEDCVTFAGELGRQAVRQALERTDLMALPSFAEGLPVVLMEAMAAEVPCVTSRIMGIPELIEDGVNGFLVPPSDWRTLAYRMEQLVSDPALRARLGRTGRQSVLRLHDAKQNARQLLALLEPWVLPA